MPLVTALTDAVRALLAQGDAAGARVALKALEEMAALADVAAPSGNVTSLDSVRKRERS